MISEKLQPCLLDRLLDEAPDKRLEGRNDRAITLSQYREGVIRDIVWLLNSHAHIQSEGLSEFPDIEASVYNYGMRSAAGLMASSLDASLYEKEIRRTLLLFEPRILPKTLEVRAKKSESISSPNVVSVEIRGELWAYPFPEKLFIKTSLDLETGAVRA